MEITKEEAEVLVSLFIEYMSDNHIGWDDLTQEQFDLYIKLGGDTEE